MASANADARNFPCGTDMCAHCNEPRLLEIMPSPDGYLYAIAQWRYGTTGGDLADEWISMNFSSTGKSGRTVAY
jgi:hypothetical protein